jgi:hypothetical protein
MIPRNGAIDFRRIDGHERARAARRDRTARLERQAEVPREAIAGADRENAQRRLASDEPFRRLVHRAVAPDGVHDVDAFRFGTIDDRIEIGLVTRRHHVVRPDA